MINKILHNFPGIRSVSIIFGKILTLKTRLFLFIFLISSASALSGQDAGLLKGYVRDSIGDPIEFANVSLLGTQEGTMSNPDGSYELDIPSGRSYTVVISCVGYRTKQFAVRLDAGISRNQDISLLRDVRAIREV